MSFFLVTVCCLLRLPFALCEFSEFLDFQYLLFYYDNNDIKTFFDF